MGTLHTGDTPFHLWVPIQDDELAIQQQLDICAEVHTALLYIKKNNIPIWEGMEILEAVVPNIDDYLEGIIKNTL